MKAYFVVFSILMGIQFLSIGYSAKVELIKHVNVSLSEDVCLYFKNGEIVRNPSSCSEQLICQNGKSMPHSKKCADNEIVSLVSMKCEPPSTKTPDTYCTPTCDKNSPKWIGDNTNCREWHECKDKQLIRTDFCPEGQMFNQTQQRCIYDNGKCEKTFNICNVVKQSTSKVATKIWDKDNCHKYYECNSKREIQEKTCELGLYYDARLGDCFPKATVNCYKHPVPEDACGNAKLAIRNRFVKDRATCRGFFYCKSKPVIEEKDNGWNYDPDLNPTWGQCGLNLFFDEELQSCLNEYDVKCSEDRCDGHVSGKVLSEKPGCQHYLECKDSYTVREVPCEDNKYFDPVAKTCVNTKISYPICK